MSRIEWILGILLVVLLVAVGVMSLLFWFRPGERLAGGAASSATTVALRADDIAPTSVFEGQTAQLAFAAAQRAAVAWQGDAVLLSATATWPQGASQQELLSGETTWGFTFYSPGQAMAVTISVVENQAELTANGPYQLAEPPLEASGWRLDSRDVVEQFLSGGGAGFMEREGVTVLTLTLLADNQRQNGRIEWLVSLFATQSLRALTMRIDATSGEVLEVIEA